MIRSCLLLLVLALPGVLSASSSMLLADDGAAFTVGSAERDITPEIGMEQPGDYRKSFHKTLHDPCKVRAAVFAAGKTRVAVVSIDALMVRRELVLAARKRITTECGIPGEAVLIHATHSHSSGPTGMIVPGEFDNASPLIQKLAYEASSNANLDYLKTVEDAVVSAVVSADQSRAAAKCSVGSGHEDQIAFNRRFFMRNGMTYTHPGAGNPEIVEPAGPIDPQLGVIGAWNDKQQLTTCVVNYACHATTSPGGISANYIYEMEKVIRGVFGEQVIVVFLAGASGDVTQVDNLTTQERPKADQWMRMVGGSIGAEAVKVLYKSEPGVLAPIAFKSKVWSIPRRVPSQEHVQKALEIVQQSPEAVGIPVWTFAKETILLDEAIKHHPKVEVEVQAIQIGPAVFLTDPAEFFCGLGLAIKAGSPFPLTFPVSLANGCVGYVPSPEAFGPRGGGYETRLTFYSNLEVTAGQQFVDAAVELAKSMTPGTIPARPTLPPFKGNPWAYGSVPPELD